MGVVQYQGWEPLLYTIREWIKHMTGGKSLATYWTGQQNSCLVIFKQHWYSQSLMFFSMLNQGFRQHLLDPFSTPGHQTWIEGKYNAGRAPWRLFPQPWASWSGTASHQLATKGSQPLTAGKWKCKYWLAEQAQNVHDSPSSVIKAVDLGLFFIWKQWQTLPGRM